MSLNRKLDKVKLLTPEGNRNDIAMELNEIDLEDEVDIFNAADIDTTKQRQQMKLLTTASSSPSTSRNNKSNNINNHRRRISLESEKHFYTNNDLNSDETNGNSCLSINKIFYFIILNINFGLIGATFCLFAYSREYLIISLNQTVTTVSNGYLVFVFTISLGMIVTNWFSKRYY
jgi:hypothetical protein